MRGLRVVTNNDGGQPDRPVDAQASTGLLLSNPTGITFTQHMTKEDAVALAERAARELGEHFDAVQILASWTEQGGTMLVKRGAGNWYARHGMCQEFIASDIAHDTAVHIAAEIRAGDNNEGDD